MPNARQLREEPTLQRADFDYHLPSERIAQEPVRPRDASRLLVIDRATRQWADSRFVDLARHLNPSDLLVLNDTRVLKARFSGTLERNGREIDILLVSPINARTWTAMLRPRRRVREGDRIRVNEDFRFEVAGGDTQGVCRLTIAGKDRPSMSEIMKALGRVPLPPYIGRGDRPEDATDYQTVYARREGAIAAPTAGLHFSSQVFADLAERSVETISLTLHVGPGTFVPVRTEDPRRHRLEAERYTLSEEAAEVLNRARTQKRRLIAVGTTTTRTLEHMIATHGTFQAGAGTTDLYILPGHRFQAVGGLVTNFHLPRTTLLLLVCAFASRDLVLDAYRHAVDTGYRFYSYGDATLFL